MTRKQFRKWKKQNILNKQKENFEANDRPEWADEAKETSNFETWRTNFLAELKEIIAERISEGPTFWY